MKIITSSKELNDSRQGGPAILSSILIAIDYYLYLSLKIHKKDGRAKSQ